MISEETDHPQIPFTNHFPQKHNPVLACGNYKKQWKALKLTRGSLKLWATNKLLDSDHIMFLRPRAI